MTIQQMTVCHADIDRFNVTTRHMTLDQTVEFVQGLYERIGEVLISHNGRLIKYLGDGALMVFERGREEVAVRAMWALRQAYRELAASAGPEVATSALNVGIATGEVSAGQMGHPQMLEYEVMGKPVSIAGVLAGLGGLVIDRPTYEAVSQVVVAEPADAVGLMRGYRVTGFR